MQSRSVSRRYGGLGSARRPARRIVRPRLQLESLETRRMLAVVISEFQAANDRTIADETGSYPDWIELLNTGAEPVDLEGWYLTDNASDLTKWQFPEVALQSGQQLLVFASGKDSNDNTETTALHTNFKLSAAGEYLALVQQDGVTIASDFSPRFEPQSRDQSFGLATVKTTAEFVTPSSPVSIFVPTDATLGKAWTEVAFDDSEWSTGSFGIGYEQLEAGYSTLDDFSGPELSSEWTVDLPQGGQSSYELTEGGLVVSVPAGQTVGEERGLAPLFLRNVPEQHADYEIVADVSLREGSSVGGVVVYDSLSGAAVLRLEFNRLTSFINQFQFSSRRRDIDTDVVFDVDRVFLRLQHDIQGKTWTASYRRDLIDDWTDLGVAIEGSNDLPEIGRPKIGLIAQNKRDIGSAIPPVEVTFSSFELNVASEEPLYTSATNSNVEAAMAGTNSSLFVRVPFTIDQDPNQLDELALAVRYDDGFVAYLNGTEVARRSAPDIVSWNSTATEPVDSEFPGLAREVIGIRAFLNQLVVGDNVLSLQGLNSAPNDSDFFLSAELGAAKILSTSLSVFTQPTPGTPNGLPAAPQPIISLNSGAFHGTETVSMSVPEPSSQLEIRFTLDGAEPTSKSTRYTEPLVISSSTLLRAKSFDTGTTSTYAPSSTTTVSLIQLAESLTSRDSDIPILILDTLGNRFPDTNSRDMATSLVAAFEPDPATGRTSLVGSSTYQGLGGLRRRGASTGGNPKPSLKFETWGDSSDDVNVPLFGLPAESDWVLYAPYTFDRTLIYESFIYGLSNDIGRYAPRTIPIEVYANTDDGTVAEDDYLGVYLLIEKIKPGENRVDIALPDPSATYDPSRSVLDQPDLAITGGYLWELDRPEPGVPTFTAGGQTINWRSPVSPHDPANIQKVTDDQQAYVDDYLNEFWSVLNDPDQDVAYDPIDGYEKYIDVDSWIDHHLLNVVAFNVNAQRISAYFHKDVGGKIEFGPIWDFDRAFESADFRDDDPTVWRSTIGDMGTDFFGEVGDGMGGRWWRQLFDDPNFFQRYIDRYHELRQTVLSVSAVDARIDLLAGVVEESSERNFARWRSVNPRSGGCSGVEPGSPSACDGTWYGEIENMRAWLHRRLAFMDNTFPFAPKLSVDGREITLPEVQFVRDGAAVTGAVPDRPLGPADSMTDKSLVSGEPGTVSISYFVPQNNLLGNRWTGVHFDDSSWNTGTNGIGYESDGDSDFAEFISTTLNPTNVNENAATIMTRTRFTVDNPMAIKHLVLQMRYDDAFVAYLNGEEVTRDNISGDIVAWNEGTGVRANSQNAQFREFDVSEFIGLLQPGENVLAIQVVNSLLDLNFDFAGGDLLLLPQLVGGTETVGPSVPGGTMYYTLDGSDPRNADGLPSDAAIVLDPDEGFVIDDAVTQMIVRNLDETYHGPESELVTTDWSAPLEYTFVVLPLETPGDLNGDGLADIEDVHLLQTSIRRGAVLTELDFDSSGVVDQADVAVFVADNLGTTVGDADLDGDVDSADLNRVGLNWQRTGDADWQNGDFNGDERVDSADLNLLGLNWDAQTQRRIARIPRAPLAALDASNTECRVGSRITHGDWMTVTDSVHCKESVISSDRQRFHQGMQRRRQTQASHKESQASHHDLNSKAMESRRHSLGNQALDTLFASLFDNDSTADRLGSKGGRNRS